jgi:hypothetical protein
MSITKRMLLAWGATLGLASAARAQGQPQGSNQAEDVLLSHQALHIAPDGRYRKITMNAAGTAMAQQHGQELNIRAMYCHHENGKTYECHDRKMADGTMLFDHMRDWESPS